MSHLQKFLEDVDTKVQFNYPTEEVLEIQNAVEEMIKHIVEKCGEKDNRFKPGRFLKVGSFYENTKIVSPNEFDFLVELTSLSCREEVQVLPDWRDGFHVCLDKRLTDTWLGKKPNEIVSEHGFLRPASVQAMFWKRLQTTVGDITEGPEKEITKCSGKLELINEVRGEYPNTVVFMSWYKSSVMESLLISADITPFIDCPDDIFRNIHVTCESSDSSRPVIVPPSLVNSKSCSIGKGRDSCCWLISFTPLEVFLVRAMKPIHRKCYKILKFICKSNWENVDPYSSDSLKTLSSYMLKMVVLAHDSHCTADGSVSACLKSVFDSLRTSAGRSLLSNFMDATKNTWTRNRTTRQRLMPEKILSMLVSFLFEKLENTYSGEYSFDKMFKILRSLQRKFYEIERKQLHASHDHVLTQSDEQLTLPSGDDYEDEKEGDHTVYDPNVASSS